LENQYPFRSFSNTYTRPGYAGLFGISGVGNLFQPGASGGSTPVLSPVTSDTTGYDPTHFPSPTVGVAYVLPKIGGPLGWIFGRDGQSVLRGGFAVASVREQFTISGVWGNNQGRSINTSVDPTTNNTAAFGPAGSVLFSNPTLPAASFPSKPNYPLPVVAGNSIFDFDQSLKSRYVESWNLGLQRTLTRDTVLEVRYVGNRSQRTWTSVNLNELNVVENGFTKEFLAAQNNLAIANAVPVSQLTSITLKSTNFFNQGLAGQQDVPVLSTALNNTGNSQLATFVAQGQAANLASSIATTVAQMARLVASGKPANYFQANPATGGSNANLTTNQGGTTYNAMQVELRRRFSKGLLVGASYAWSHSLNTGQLLTLRDREGITTPLNFDQRHGIKLNWVYEFPLGRGHQALGNLHNAVLRKAVEGWQVAGIARIQSGTPSQLNSGRFTFNGIDGGVVLHNITTSQLQSMMAIRKVDLAATATSPALGAVYYLPQTLIDNTNAAFEVNGKTLKDLNPSAPYIGPADQPGELGQRVFLYGPGQQKWDFSLVKKTAINERFNVEFRMQALNAINRTNFLLFVPGNGITTTLGVNGTGFGQTNGAYKDLSNTNDPGGRIVEFSLRLNF